MTRARELSKLGNTNVIAADSSNNVGIGSTQPDAKLDVAGVVTATSYYGSGANLTDIVSGISLQSAGSWISAGTAATTFNFQSGATLTNVDSGITTITITSAGLGTPVNTDSTDPMNRIYYTNKILDITSTSTVDVPSSAIVGYTQHPEIAVSSGIDLIIADGDELVPDILGLSTEGVTILPGAGGRVRADNLLNREGTGAPTLPKGLDIVGLTSGLHVSGISPFANQIDANGSVDITGIVTESHGVRAPAGGINVVAGVSTFAGAIAANSTLDVDGDTQVDDFTASGVSTFSNSTASSSVTTGAVIISGGVGIAKDLYVGGEVSVAGTMTYEDVTNIDAVGFITARSGVVVDAGGVVVVGGGVSIGAGGLEVTAGISTFTKAATFEGALKESCTTSTNTVNVYNIDLVNGNVHKFDTNGSGAGTVYVTYNGGNNVNTFMATNETVSLSVIAKPNSAGYINAMQIDGTGTGVTVEWSSDSAAVPSSANDGAYDLYAFNIVKTGSAAYLVFASRTKFN